MDEPTLPKATLPDDLDVPRGAFLEVDPTPDPVVEALTVPYEEDAA